MRLYCFPGLFVLAATLMAIAGIRESKSREAYREGFEDALRGRTDRLILPEGFDTP